MTLPDSNFKKTRTQADDYKRVIWGLVIVSVMLVIAMVLLLTPSQAKAQVSVFTNPDSDAIVFETYKATTVVVPKSPGTSVTIPSTYGDSTYSVSPGGYVTRTFEVDNDD